MDLTLHTILRICRRKQKVLRYYGWQEFCSKTPILPYRNSFVQLSFMLKSSAFQIKA